MSAKYNFSEFSDLPAVLYNENDSITKLFVRINTSDLLYESENEMQALKAWYSIHYDLFLSYTDNNIIDSNTFTFVDSMGITGVIIPHEFDVKSKSGNNYILRIKLNDLNSGEFVVDYKNIRKESANSRNNFLLFNQYEKFSEHPFVTSSSQYFLKNNNNPDRLFVRYYKRNFPIALPPFVENKMEKFDYTPDSSFQVIMLDSISELSFPDVGFYHFQIDTLNRDGISMFNFYDGFPELVRSKQLLEPLRYITTLKEYESLEAMEDYKLAADEFWLENAGNPMRARNMIKKFYNRVVDANVYFSSYQEGWKTDRGLVYIVFGPPKLVYFSDDTEEWIYGEEGHINSIRFQFYKVNNPFTDNDYSLLKSAAFKEKWYEAVNMWRR